LLTKHDFVQFVIEVLEVGDEELEVLNALVGFSGHIGGYACRLTVKRTEGKPMGCGETKRP
jgi:hypothetical protein